MTAPSAGVATLDGWRTASSPRPSRRSIRTTSPRSSGRAASKAELDEVIEWLTGFDEKALDAHLAAETTFEDFFGQAHLNPNVSAITGTVCGVRVEDVEDPLMQKIRYLDKLVDELAKGRTMDKVLRA